MHARIADALEREFPGLVEAEPEVLAHHCTQAGLAERAVEYWSRAGDLAIRRSANEEAVGHLGRGLDLPAKRCPRAASATGGSWRCGTRSAVP